MEDIKINDESGDRKYFTQLPNIILNHSTANDQALYMQMKRYAGEDGKCFATEETLCKKLGIGRKAYWKSRDYLLKRKWIKFEGLTQGKTRPIKTYSVVDIWKQNIMEYEKIPSERNISFNAIDNSQKEEDKSQKEHKITPKRDTEEEHSIKKNQEEELTSKTSFAEIQTLIDLFKSVNPSYKQFFGNKTERACLTRMLQEHGREKLTELIEVLPKTNSMDFAPVITSPYKLEKKLGDLIVFIEKEKIRIVGKKIITL